MAHRMQARLAAMQKHPPSAAQVEYLKALGDKLAAPATMAEASERIEALKQKQQGPDTGSRRMMALQEQTPENLR
jgi:hypothetical protein